MSDFSQSLNLLNPQQREAVFTQDGPLLIIAGAGSGKTGVITARITQMLKDGIPQSNILALTFTNKAAKEMRERVKAFSGSKLTNLTVSTFHSFGVQVLRENTKAAGLRPKFSIYDEADKISTLREAARELKLNFEPADIKALASLFSDIKTRRKSWDKVTLTHKPLFEEYLELMTLHNAVDFDDLIIKALWIFETQEDILEQYRQRYRYIMVDEFQDTSMIQYQLIRHLAETHRNLCCVGDDDQSIYSWRGANYANIVNFEKDFPECREIKLERNYRSTSTILNAANAVIANNTDRKEKVLWTSDNHDEMTLRFTAPEDDVQEATFIAESILSIHIEEDCPYEKIGILVRTNALIRSIEEALLACNIPYSVSGSTSFFGRQEIKDIIAYLRVIENPDDDVNFLRIINKPRRGIGKSTLSVLVDMARLKRCSLYSAAADIVFGSGRGVGQNIQKGLAEFIDTIEQYQDIFSTEKISLSDTLNELVEEIAYWTHLVQEFQHNDKIAKWRYENIKTFIDMLARWESNPDNLDVNLSRWLNLITLNTRDHLQDGDDSKVNLMTIHASKGLEFDVVYLPGMEEGILPHAKSLEENPDSLQEERRLFYVAITRARRKLFISSCRTRKIRLEKIVCSPSPFLEEIPTELMEDVEAEEPVSQGEDVSHFFAKMPWK